MAHTTRILTLALALSVAGLAQAQDQSLAAARAEAKAAEAKRIELVQRISKAFVAIGGGSGIIVSKDGEIITNDHVAGRRPIGSTWVVIRPGGKFAKAKLIATDPRGDISYLKMIDPGPYPFVPFADSDKVVAGQQVIALGNPFGFSKNGTPNVTLGIVSAVHRYQGGYSDAIMTDTPINPGNSGGPLIDMHGRLIGINGRIAMRYGTRNNTGVGYAIPTNQIQAFMPSFRAGGKVSHAVARGLRLSVISKEGGIGAVVRSTAADSFARRAGLQAEDVIVEAGGRKVHNARRFHGIVGTYPAGATIEVVAKRAGVPIRFKLQLDSRDSRSARPKSATGGYLGVRLSNADTGGVEVSQVVDGSPADKAGVEAGDVILAINGSKVKDLTAFVAVLKPFSPGQSVTLTISRNGSEQRIKVKLGKRPPAPR